MIKGSIGFKPDNPIFKEHFPGNPIVPGSQIIRAFYTICLEYNLKIKKPLKLNRFKFNSFLKPGIYNYRIEVHENGIKCRLYNDLILCASGIFL